MEELLCSVVMTVYNAEKYLKEAIDSVLRQTESRFELIIVNDCSTDSSEEIIKSYTTKKAFRAFHLWNLPDFVLVYM